MIKTHPSQHSDTAPEDARFRRLVAVFLTALIGPFAVTLAVKTSGLVEMGWPAVANAFIFGSMAACLPILPVTMFAKSAHWLGIPTSFEGDERERLIFARAIMASWMVAMIGVLGFMMLAVPFRITTTWMSVLLWAIEVTFVGSFIYLGRTR